MFIQDKDHLVKISEPLTGLQQTSQAAEVKALCSALEVVWALRPRHAVLFCDSIYTTKAYTSHMTRWHDSNWRDELGAVIPHRDRWQEIVKYPGRFEVRGMQVEVKWAPEKSCEGMVEAEKLAEHGCTLHEVCGFCKRNVGRKGARHDCFPICLQASCEGRAFSGRKAYKIHCRSSHAGEFPCRREDCSALLGSQVAVLSHEQMAHDEYVFCCDYCDEVFCVEEEQKDHEVKECAFAPYCRVCRKWFEKWKSFAQHKKDAHGEYD